ncbi:uncharacterized protein H6S33_011956 [Morchella sextelata]|uniref:uncharacterized protein n=1 Tax=Morchella sextelata TaxID=1174677 RepID=UPI001D0542E3|nr:uncharacterized protein H6S33_011956 [Morchella sextelata]KAH0610429.1 hypothetical protein H6S33_011956 [Morchella sextelata]
MSRDEELTTRVHLCPTPSWRPQISADFKILQHRVKIDGSVLNPPQRLCFHIWDGRKQPPLQVGICISCLVGK